MIVASFSGLLRIIFWILLVSFLVRLIARLALPVVIRKASEQMNQQFGKPEAPRKPGEVKVETPPSQNKSSGTSDMGGEYVDFKEIKE